MNELDFLEGINELSPESLSVSAPAKAKSRPGMKRWIAVAAAAVLVFGCVTAGAVSYSKGRFSPITSGTHGFNADFEIKRFPWDEFKGGITEAPDIIIDQYATFTPAPALSSVMVTPGYYFKRFLSFKEMADYIGLDELKNVGSPFSEDYSVGISGDSAGNIGSIYITTRHVVNPGDPSTGRFGGAMSITIYTENSESSTVRSGGDWGDYDPGKIEYDEFITSKGVLCQYAEVGVSDRERAVVSGYVVDSGILYSLWINFSPEDHDEALQMLKEWAERF